MSKINRETRKSNDLNTNIPDNTTRLITPAKHRTSNTDRDDSGIDFDEKHNKIPVLYATLSNITDITNKTTIEAALDNISGAPPGLIDGDLMLFKDQSTGSENGIYIWDDGLAEAFRAPDSETNGELRGGSEVRIVLGDIFNGKKFYISSPSLEVDIGTDAIVFTLVADAGLIEEKFQFSSDLDTVRLGFLKGFIVVNSFQNSAGLSTGGVTLETSDDNGATYTARASVAALNTWLLANISGDELTGDLWQIRITAVFNASEVKPQGSQMIYTR